MAGLGLTVRIDLEDEGDVSLQGDPISVKAGLAVTFVRMTDDFKAFAQLGFQGVQNARGVVGRSIVDREQDEIPRGVLPALETSHG